MSISFAQQRQTGLSGLYGDFDNFGVPGQQEEKPYQLTARIVADPEKTIDGYLIVRMDLKPDWYVYSVTQPKGGPLPTKIEIVPNDIFEILSGFTASTLPKSEMNDIFEMIIETHYGSISWAAPLKLKPDTALESLQISGGLNGQVCRDDACIPINEQFQAVFSDVDATEEIAAAKQTYLNAGSPKTTPKAAPSGSGVFNLDQLDGEETVTVQSLWRALFLSFVGGLILNIMPCVLPVIGLKILSFFEQAGKNRMRAFMLNVWYTFGILTVFGILAALSVGLSTMFTYSVFGIIMCCVVFAMALSLMDVWELRVPTFLGTGKSAELMQQEGGVGAYFKGIITTLLAIPCGAPFLSPALAWADTQVKSGAQTNVFIAYFVIGLGMAAPFLIIGAFPELIRFLPKPGQWMDTFKKTMGFALLIAVVWILYFIPMESVVPTLALIFAIWFCCWFIGSLTITAPTGKRLMTWGIAGVVFCVTLLLSFPVIKGNPYNLEAIMRGKLDRTIAASLAEVQTMSAAGDLGKDQIDKADEEILNRHWTNFTLERLEQELLAGKDVIVDFTADWCLSCKELEFRVLHNKNVLAKIDELDIVTLQADWTNRDPVITQMLQKLGGEQVPVVAIFKAESPNNPKILRGSFRVKTFIEHLTELENLKKDS